MNRVSIAIAVLAASTAVTSIAKDSDPVSVDAMSTQGVAMQVDNPGKLAGIHRVAIASFMVDIVDDLKAEQDISGVELVAGAPSEVSIKVVGTDPLTYQAMVDSMYETAVRDLMAQGFEVVSNQDLLANADFAKLVARNNENPRRIHSAAGENLYYTTHNLPQIVTDELSVIPKFTFPMPFAKKPKADPYIGSFSVGMNSGMALATSNSIAKQLNAAMINVRITLLGSQASLDKNFWTQGGDAHAAAAVGMTPLYNRYLIMLPDGGRARIALRDQVTSTSTGELVKVTSGTKQASQTVGNVARVAGAFGMLGGFSGIGRSIKYAHSIDYEARMDPAKFGDAVEASFSKVSSGLATELAARR